MRKCIILFMFVGVFAPRLIIGQTIIDVMNNESLSYFEKVEQIEEPLSNLKAGVDNSILKRYMRWRSFWDNRIGTDGSQTAYAVEWHNIFNSSTIPAGGTGTAWEFVGPKEDLMNIPNYMGHVASLAVDPNNQNIVYAGATTGGLWKTTNPTAVYPHWECLTNNYAGMGVSDVVVHPDNSSIIYIVTGIHFNGMMKMTGDYSLGAYKSTNGGLTYNLMMGLSPEENIYLSKLVFDPNNSSIMYILSSKTIYKSTDGGSTWSDTYVNPGNVKFRKMIINPANTSEIYISGTNAIYKTTNAGSSWLQITTLGNPSESNINVAWHPVENCIYALYENGSDDILKKSTNGGSSWSYINTVSSVKNYVNALTISPNGNIYAGGIYIYKSLDNGINFTYQSSMHADIRDILFPNGANDNIAYIATDGGVVRNITGTDDDWISCNGDLCVRQFYDIAISEQDPDLLLGGTHDCGNFRRKENGIWELVQVCDGGTSNINPNNKNIQFATAGVRLNRTVDGGYFNEYTGVEFVTYDGAFAFDPTNSNIIYASETSSTGNAQLLKSTNGGAAGSFSVLDDAAWGVIFDIEVNELNPNYIYYSTFDWWNHNFSRLRKSTNGGLSFVSIDFSYIKAPIRDIITHPDDPQKVWIAFGGLNAGYKVLYSSDAGSTWQNITFDSPSSPDDKFKEDESKRIIVTNSGLPNLPVNKMLYDDINERIIIANDIGVYYRYDNGANWNRLGSSLPNMIVTDLELNKTTGDLFIASFGRGIWKLHLEEYCYSSAQPFISGPGSVCPSSSTTFSLNNRPLGTTVNWTKSSNLTYVSGQGTDNYRVNGSPGWVQAVISSTECADFTVIKQFSDGSPSFGVAQISGPTQLTPGLVAVYSISSAQGATSYNWDIPTGCYAHYCWNIRSGQGSTLIDVQAGSVGSDVINCSASNFCGTDSRFIYINVQEPNSGGGGVGTDPCDPYMTISPNPNQGNNVIVTVIYPPDPCDETMMYTETDATVSIVNNMGQTVYSKKHHSNNLNIKGLNLSSGLYHVKYVKNNIAIEKSIIVE